MQSPGKGGASPNRFPSVNRVALNNNKPTVLVFVHPLCPCTPATISQLETITTAAHITVIQSGPAVGLNKPDTSHRSTQDHRLGRQMSDASGELSRAFGAMTSGHVVAYSPEGELLFSGGVTPGRAMTGPSKGLTELREALQSHRRVSTSTDVFGCSIFGSACCDYEGSRETQNAACCSDGESV